jgi:hypothetical protein
MFSLSLYILPNMFRKLTFSFEHPKYALWRNRHFHFLKKHAPNICWCVFFIFLIWKVKSLMSKVWNFCETARIRIPLESRVELPSGVLRTLNMVMPCLSYENKHTFVLLYVFRYIRRILRVSIFHLPVYTCRFIPSIKDSLVHIAAFVVIPKYSVIPIPYTLYKYTRTLLNQLTIEDSLSWYCISLT